MSLTKLLTKLSIRNVTLWAEGGQLRFRAPPGALDPVLREEVLFLRSDLLSLFERVDSITSSFPQASFSRARLPMTSWHDWYLRNFAPDEYSWAMTFAIDFGPNLSPNKLERALSRLIAKHDAFHLRLARDSGGDWLMMRTEGGGSAHFAVRDFRNVSAVPADTVADVARQLSRKVSIVSGPAIAIEVCLFSDPHENRALVSTLHEILDGSSVRIVIDEIIGWYFADSTHQHFGRVEGESYEKYLYAQNGIRRDPMFVARALAYWTEERAPSPRLPRDFEGGRHLTSNSRRLEATISAELRLRLEMSGRLRGAYLNEVLLYGLTQAYAAWTGGESLEIDFEHHGRSETRELQMDLSGLVGITGLKFPLHLSIERSAPIGDDFLRMIDTVDEAVEHGHGYGILRYQADTGPSGEPHFAKDQEIFFNNRTTLSAPKVKSDGFQPRVIGLSTETSQSSDFPVSYDLIIECDNNPDNSVALTLTYSSAVHRESTMTQFAASYIAALTSLADALETVE